MSEPTAAEPQSSFESPLAVAMQADMQQWFTNQLTPDRAYPFPTDNTAAHVASELAPLQRINKRAAEDWAADHTALEKLCVECGVEFDENEDMKSISELVEVLRAPLAKLKQEIRDTEELWKAAMRERDQLRADLSSSKEAGFHAGAAISPRLYGKARIAELENDLSAAREDSARIDWLRHKALGSSDDIALDALLGCKRWTSLREAIDAARKSTP